MLRVILAAAVFVLLAALAAAVINRVFSFEKDDDAEAVEMSDPIRKNSYSWDHLDTSYPFYSYEDETWTSLAGIDVSVHQGSIDWQKAAESGVQFAIVRAGYRGYQEGALHEDDCFRANVEGAENAGLKVGVYWFSQAVSVDEALEEADYLLTLLKEEPVDGPVCFDMEYVTDNDRIQSLTQREMTDIAAVFLQRISDAGYETFCYGSESWLNSQIAMSQLQDLTKFWIAGYHTDHPDFVHDFEMWQYSDNGTIDGIDGSVDLDLWFVRKQ